MGGGVQQNREFWRKDCRIGFTASLWIGGRSKRYPTVASLLLITAFGHETRGRTCAKLEAKVLTQKA